MKVLNHPNIVRFKEEFATYEYLYYVIELVDGMDLYQYISQRESLEEAEASVIMGEILQAVKYLNNVGIVHRDLKPENIMLRVDKSAPGQQAADVKIIDFGFAMYLKEANVSSCCGTINYVAPEVFMGKPYNAKTDIFSLGVILFFMLRGELPFSHPVKEVVIKNIIKGNYNMDTDEFFLKVSEDAKHLIKGMLETRLSDRFDIDDCLEHPFIAKHRRKKRMTQGTLLSSSGGSGFLTPNNGVFREIKEPKESPFAKIQV